MTDGNRISRRKFLTTSMGGVAAASLGCWDVFAEQKPRADLIIQGSPVLTMDNRDSILAEDQGVHSAANCDVVHLCPAGAVQVPTSFA